MFRKARTFLLSIFITLIYRALSITWRVTHLRRPAVFDSKSGSISAHWHGDELLLIDVFSRRGMAVMASRSRDGEVLQKVLTWMGYRVVRGSSSRGGAGGLKGLLDVVKKEHCEASLAVDGPRGPIYEVKPGIIKLAQETGLPLVMGAAAASPRYVFQKAWNRCYLPGPFARCVVVYGEPMLVPRHLSEEEFEKYRLQLQNQLLSLKTEAESHFRVGLPAGCSAVG